MRFKYFMELIFFAIGMIMAISDLITDQYLYRKMSEKHNYTSNTETTHCHANLNSSSNEKEIVANEVSNWKIYINLASGLPAIVSSVIIASWSDKVGRKIPLALLLAGCTVRNILQLVVIAYGWPLFVLIIGSAVFGIIGGLNALFNIGTTFLSDITTQDERTKRYVILQSALGLGGGLGSVVCGFWIAAEGFVPISWFLCACNFVSIVFVWFLPSMSMCQKLRNDSDILDGCKPILENSVSKYGSLSETNYDMQENTKNNERDLNDAVRSRSIWEVYMTETSSCHLCGIGPDTIQTELCEHGGGLRKGRVWRMWVYLISSSVFLYPFYGVTMISSMYLLAHPLCFTPTLLGAYSGLMYFSMVVSPVIVVLGESVLKWKNDSIVMLCMVMTIVSYTLTGLARKPYLVFIGNSLYMFSVVAEPVIRSQISTLASEYEQGAAFSLVTGAETFASTLGYITYLLIYPATLQIVQGFIWFASSVVVFIPLMLLIIVWITDKRKSMQHREEVSNKYQKN